MYDKYGLVDNPFKLEHDHEIVGSGQNKTFDKVLELFKSYSAFKERSGDRFIAAFQGEYGFGKSVGTLKVATLNTRYWQRGHDYWSSYPHLANLELGTGQEIYWVPSRDYFSSSEKNSTTRS